jgi:glycosyltransferase involved in cell wall biosynthesis
MRTLIISSYLQGLLFFREQLIIHLLSEGHNLDIIAPIFDHLNTERDVKKHLGNSGVEVINIEVSRKSVSIVKEILAAYTVYKKATEKRYDTIIFFFPKAYYFLRLATLPVRAKKIVIMDGLGKYFTNYYGQSNLVSAKKYFVRKALITLLKFNHLDNGKICVLNIDDYNYLVKNLPKINIKLLPIKGSSPLYGIKQTKTIKSVYVGRLTYEKGCRDLKVLKEKLGDDLRIFGKYDEAIPNSERLVLDGWAENVPQVLSDATFLLLTSYREGLSTIVQEAFAQKCVVVAYDVPGVRNLIINGDTGFLVAPGDYNSILNVVNSITKSEIEKMSNSALNFHKQHLNEVKNIQTFCRELLE